MMPALLTWMSSRPNRLSTSSYTSRHDWGSVTSSGRDVDALAVEFLLRRRPGFRALPMIDRCALGRQTQRVRCVLSAGAAGADGNAAGQTIGDSSGHSRPRSRGGVGLGDGAGLAARRVRQALRAAAHVSAIWSSQTARTMSMAARVPGRARNRLRGRGRGVRPGCAGRSCARRAWPGRRRWGSAVHAGAISPTKYSFSAPSGRIPPAYRTGTPPRQTTRSRPRKGSFTSKPVAQMIESYSPTYRRRSGRSGLEPGDARPDRDATVVHPVQEPVVEDPSGNPVELFEPARTG